MEKELFVFDVIDFLPEPIRSLLFQERTELIIKDALRLTNDTEEKEVEINILLSDLLIGKISLEEFKASVFNALTDKKNSLLAYEYLYQKLFKNIVTLLDQARKTYIKLSQGAPQDHKSASPSQNYKNTDLSSYIQSQAEQIKRLSSKEEPPSNEKVNNISPLSSKVDPAVDISDAKELEKIPSANLTAQKTIPDAAINCSLEQLSEEAQTPLPKKSHLASMIDSQKRKEVKLSEYYKNLKNNMNNDFNADDQKTNIFQPPYKSKKGGAMVETSFENSFTKNPALPDAQPTPTVENTGLKDPIKYNSVNINPPSMPTFEEGSDIETDDKFIDLGGTF